MPALPFRRNDMAYKELIVSLSVIVATSPISAAQPEPTPETGAPVAAADARYCLRVEPVTGTRLETVECWTREEWAEQDVDVDKEWAEEGVRIIS
jgi:hypothetical protein